MPQAKFVLKEPNSEEHTLVYLFYYFNTTKLKYSTSQKILPKYWNAEKQRAKEVKAFSQHTHFNFLLDKLETTVNNVYRKLVVDDIVPTPEILRDMIEESLNKKESPKKDFITFFETVLESSDRKAGTKKAIRQTLNILKDFSDQKGTSLQFDAIDLDFYNEFIDFLIKKDLKQSTIGNHIKNIKVFMREAFERGLTKNMQFRSRGFKKLDEESHSIYLTIEELKKLYDLDLSDKPRLDKVRDLFLIACYTGLRFSDLMQLKIESLNREKKVIKVKTQKTEELVIIPINSIVSNIIEKYEGNLPLAISNQKMNDYLKEIGELAGMEEAIERVATKGGKRIREVFKKYEMVTAHTARRSFATNAYLQNVPTISIMKITGHKTEKSFLKYIKISQEDNANKLVNHPFFQ
jgi:site-specific recombinase XerD